MRVNLTQKGLIYLSIPLIAQLIFFCVMLALVWQAQEAANRATQARNIISKVGVLSNRCLDAGGALLSYAFERRFNEETANAALQDYQKSTDAIPVTLKELHTLTAGNYAYEQHVNRLEKISNRVLEFLQQYKTEMENNSNLSTLMKGYQLKKKLHDPFRDQVVEISKQLRTEEDLQSTVQQSTLNVLYIGIAVDLLIMILLCVQFCKNISLRIATLNDNAMRVASRKDLNAPMGGSDEIAELDRMIHAMSRALRKAETEKQEFFSMISHDLRTPLTALLGTLALIGRGSYGQISEQGHQRLEKSEANVLRLIKLINELLDMEKFEAGSMVLERRDVGIQEIVDAALDLVQGFAEHKQIEIVSSTVDATISVDKDRLVQVLGNLLSNAIKFSEEKGKVEVSVQDSPKSLEIIIQDHGAGMPPESLKTIFDRFKQVNQSDNKFGAGTGLGLAICKTIVEAHNGSINVRSEVGKGSTFVVKIPH